MRASRSVLTAALLSGLLGSCDTVVDPPPRPEPGPVIEALLIAGNPTSTFRIRRVTDNFGAAEPIPPADVHLLLSEAGNRSVPLVSLAMSAGTFQASMPIVAGGQYQLAGTVAGRAISAHTTVPTSFTVLAPNGPIVATEPVDYLWRSVGAVAYLVDSAFFNSTFRSHASDTAGKITILLPESRRPELTIYAVNSDAAQYLFDIASARSNIIGGFGMLGGAIAARRPLIWP